MGNFRALQKQKSKWGILFLNPMGFVQIAPCPPFTMIKYFLIKNRNPQFDAWKVRPAPVNPPHNDEKKTTNAEPTSIIVFGGQGAILE